ncbi:hypothetical protein [Parafrankia discariae]|uniref:hypothetical protein n=1 Tax=Parafrankia discariae TaxID=365528 RepID=UPI00038191D5|nr:hypothetical protein [Parafrankia discariae]
MRASLLTDDVAAKLCAAMRVGSYQVEAARFAGIGQNTLTTWLRRGRDDIAAGRLDTAHARLVAEFEQAEATAVVGALGVIQRAAAAGDWRAALAWLGRRHSDRWGEKGPGTTVVNVGVEPGDIDLVKAVQAAQEKAAAQVETLRAAAAAGELDDTAGPAATDSEGLAEGEAEA